MLLSGRSGLVEMTRFSMIKMSLICRYSTVAQLLSVHGLPYNGRDIETSLRRHVLAWRRWQGTFFHNMGGRLIAGLDLHRPSSLDMAYASYIILLVVMRLLLHNFLLSLWISAVCIFDAETGCNA